MANNTKDEFTKELIGDIFHKIDVENLINPKDTQHIIELINRTIIVMLANINKIKDDRIAKQGY